MAKYIIGIDLGTTNCTVAYAKTGDENPTIEQFAIPQIIAANTQGENFSFPSFIYFPMKEEAVKTSYYAGIHARDRGAEVAHRLLSSAKSWLCHAGIDRRAPLLPLSEDFEGEKLSPLQASAALLKHIKDAWDEKMPSDPLINQQVFITVPASFDPSARQLVQEAAKLAGYPEAVLIEEPQAAFYAWLYTHAETWRNRLKVGDSILVVDIGGGTTDFSLITVDNENGNLTLQRRAVGSHLLLGGDNIDLSLAYFAKSKLEDLGHNIDEWQFQSLIHACRQAKETLMSADTPSSVDVTIMGRSSKLIGGSLTVPITQVEIQKLIIDGFMPLTSPQERATTERRGGIQQIGLPYAQDARISCQLAKFLSLTGESDSDAMDKFVIPTAVLLNGGTMKAAALQKRLLDLLNQWAKALHKPAVQLLTGADLDFAVSRGAVYYGIAREGKAIRIKSGTSRSYFIGIEEAAPAVPGIAAPLKALCVVPYGLEEGSEQAIGQQEFSLVVGEPATFRFFSHATRELSSGEEPHVGFVLKNWKKELTELPAVETSLEKGADDSKTIRVSLTSKLTELGVLELWCVAKDGRKWKLEFNARI